MASTSGSPPAMRHTPMRAPRSASAVEPVRPSAGRPGSRRSRGPPGPRPGSRSCVMAASTTWRAIGPAVSCCAEIGTTPDAADEPERRLEPDDARRPRRADDRAVGLGADRDLGQRGGDARARTAGRTARVAVEHVGVVGLAADARSSPTSSRLPRKLAHSERFALPRITAPADRSRRTSLASRPGGRRAAPASRPVLPRSAVSMLSLSSTGTPSSCCAGRAPPVRVAGAGLGQRRGVELQDRVHVVVDVGDPAQVGGGQRPALSVAPADPAPGSRGIVSASSHALGADRRRRGDRSDGRRGGHPTRRT